MFSNTIRLKTNKMKSLVPFFLFLYLALSFQIAEAQEERYFLKGQITTLRLEPLRKVRVTIMGVNGVGSAITNEEGEFWLELPKSVQIGSNTIFSLNGLQITERNFNYSRQDNFVAIRTDGTVPPNPFATRQIFKVTIKDQGKKPVTAGTEVLVGDRHYITNDKGQFVFDITTKSRTHQVTVVHADSSEIAPELRYSPVNAPKSGQSKEKGDRLDSLFKSRGTESEQVDKIVASLEIKKAEFGKQTSLLKKEIENLEKLRKTSSLSTEQSVYLDRLKTALGAHYEAFEQVQIVNDELSKYMQRVKVQRDSLISADMDKIKLMERDQKQVAALREMEANQSKNQLLSFSLIISFLLIFLIFVYLNTRKIKRQRSEIMHQARDLHEANEANILQNQKLAEQKEALQQTLEDLKNAQAQVIQSEKMASLGQLVAGIAHEINNPVNFVYAGSESLRTVMNEMIEIVEKYEETDNLEPEKLPQFQQEIKKLKRELEYDEVKNDIVGLVGDIRSGAVRTAEIVKGLRTFSRLDEHDLKTADLHENLDSTLVILRNQYKNRIEVVKEYDETLPNIDCYPGQLNQVFMNIIANAIQAIQDEGTITIQTQNRPTEGNIRITIADSGPGIPEHIKNKIFEPFFTTKDVGKGTGLGLSISLGIIGKHSGSIELESEVGKGTKFIITLPVHFEQR